MVSQERLLTALRCAFGSLDRVDLGLGCHFGLDVGGEVAVAAFPFVGRIRIAGAEFLIIKSSDSLAALALLNAGRDHKAVNCYAFSGLYRIRKRCHIILQMALRQVRFLTEFRNFKSNRRIVKKIAGATAGSAALTRKS